MSARGPLLNSRCPPSDAQHTSKFDLPPELTALRRWLLTHGDKDVVDHRLLQRAMDGVAKHQGMNLKKRFDFDAFLGARSKENKEKPARKKGRPSSASQVQSLAPAAEEGNVQSIFGKVQVGEEVSAGGRAGAQQPLQEPPKPPPPAGKPGSEVSSLMTELVVPAESLSTISTVSTGSTDTRSSASRPDQDKDGASAEKSAPEGSAEKAVPVGSSEKVGPPSSAEAAAAARPADAELLGKQQQQVTAGKSSAESG